MREIERKEPSESGPAPEEVWRTIRYLDPEFDQKSLVISILKAAGAVATAVVSGFFIFWSFS